MDIINRMFYKNVCAKCGKIRKSTYQQYFGSGVCDD